VRSTFVKGQISILGSKVKSRMSIVFLSVLSVSYLVCMIPIPFPSLTVLCLTALIHPNIHSIEENEI